MCKQEGAYDSKHVQKIQSETGVTPKALCGLGWDGIENLWAGLSVLTRSGNCLILLPELPPSFFRLLLFLPDLACSPVFWCLGWCEGRSVQTTNEFHVVI